MVEWEFVMGENCNLKTSEVIFETIKREDFFESERTAQLDQKAVSLLGFSGIIASLSMGLGSIIPQNVVLYGCCTFAYLIIFLLTVFCFFVAAAFSLSSLFPKDYHRIKKSELQKLAKPSTFKNETGFIRGNLAQTHLNCLEKDRKVNYLKVQRLKWSYIFITVGGFLIFLQALILAISSII